MTSKNSNNENYTSTNILNKFEHSIFDDSSKDIMIDYAELGIDKFFTNDILKEIPILKSIIAISKVGYNIHERNLYNQTVVFLNEFNNTQDTEKVKQHREKIKNNSKMLQDELGRILIILNRNIDLEKSKFLAKFYSAYIDRKYEWATFCELSDITDKLFISDIKSLEKVYKNNGVKEGDKITHNHERLISIGLLKNDQRSGGLLWHNITVGDLSGNQDSNGENQTLIEITDIGQIFCEVIFKS